MEEYEKTADIHVLQQLLSDPDDLDEAEKEVIRDMVFIQEAYTYNLTTPPPPPPRPEQAIVDSVTSYEEIPFVEMVENANNNNASPLMRGGGASKVTEALLQRLKVGVYFGLWYALNIVYNST